MPSHGGEVSSRHDAVVTGAGPAGEAAAELGGSLGCSVALVERDIVGAREPCACRPAPTGSEQAAEP